MPDGEHTLLSQSEASQPTIEMEGSVSTCATCIHWKANTGWTDLYAPSNGYEMEESDPERWAQIEAHNRQSSTCKKVQEGWADDDKTQPLPLATCWDGSGYKATLNTHRDFGCVLHEGRDPMPDPGLGLYDRWIGGSR